MARPENTVSQAKEAALWLDETIRSEFGESISLPDPIVNKRPSEPITFRFNDDFKPGPLVPVGANRDWLPYQIGSGFLICFYRPGLKEKLYPGVVNSMTSQGELHFTYLDNPINRNENFTVDPVQELVLRGSAFLQDKRLGTEESHETVAHVASEIGHLAMVVRSLSNPAVMNAGTQHAVHGWSARPGGLVGAMSNGTADNVPGAFDIGQPMDIKHFAVRPGEADLTLVYSSNFGLLKPQVTARKKNDKVDEVASKVITAEKKNKIPQSIKEDVNPAIALLGLAVVAARGRLGTRKANTQLLRALHSL